MFKDQTPVQQSLSQTSDHAFHLPLNADRQEIRLLDLQPCAPDEDQTLLVCEMRTTSLTETPQSRFEAISYTWGDTQAAVEINVNGVSRVVPRSTAAALRRVREVGDVRTIWIDAACINQQDIEERNSQVALMAAIYQTAWRVIVWLGYPGFDTNKNLGIISTLNTAVDSIIAWAVGVLQTSDHEALIDRLASYKDLQPLHRPFPTELLSQYAQVYALCHQLWFSRRWVVQEFALAQQTICYWGPTFVELERALVAAVVMARGSPDIDQWKTIHDLSGYGSTHRASIGELYKAAHTWQVLHMPPARDPGALLSAILKQLQDLLSSEPRDLVYATLGLWQSLSGVEDLPPLLRPDYSKPVGVVFAHAQRYIMMSDKSLNVLQDTRTSEPWPADSRGASWIKRWGVWYLDAPSLLPTCFNACGGRPYEVDLREADVELWLRSVEVGNVTDCVKAVLPDALSTSAQQRAFIATVSTTLNVDVADNQRYEPLRPLIRTLVAGLTWHGQSPAAVSFLTDAELDEAVAFASDRLNAQDYVVPDRTVLQSSLSASARYSYGLRRACGHRSIFRTADGHFGLGSSRTMEGDVLAVVYGCDFPLLLRPCHNGYELLGCSYVDGFMRGEAAEACESRELAERVFVLL